MRKKFHTKSATVTEGEVDETMGRKLLLVNCNTALWCRWGQDSDYQVWNICTEQVQRSYVGIVASFAAAIMDKQVAMTARHRPTYA